MEYNIKDYAFRTYVERDDNEAYFVVEFYDYPFCFGAGQTPQEAYDEAINALKNHLESLKEKNLPIKVPTNIFSKDYSGRFTTRVSPNVHREISLYADEFEISLNQFVSDSITYYLGSLEREHLLSSTKEPSIEQIYAMKEIWEKFDSSPHRIVDRSNTCVIDYQSKNSFQNPFNASRVGLSS